MGIKVSNCMYFTLSPQLRKKRRVTLRVIASSFETLEVRKETETPKTPAGKNISLFHARSISPLSSNVTHLVQTRF